MNSLLDIKIPRWAGMLVKGKNVTPNQAIDIITRTDSFEFHSMDGESELDSIECVYGERLFYSELSEKYEHSPEILLNKIKKYRVLHELYYLRNYYISSGGLDNLYGWCNWDGTIQTNDYNIGKSVHLLLIYNEWKIIAKSFPYLNLKCQLLDGELPDENIHRSPLIEFKIKNGKVSYYSPKKLILEPAHDDRDSYEDIDIPLENIEDVLRIVEMNHRKEKINSLWKM